MRRATDSHGFARIAIALVALAGCTSWDTPPEFTGMVYTQQRFYATENELLIPFNPMDLQERNYGVVWPPGRKLEVLEIHPKVIEVEDEEGDNYYFFPEPGTWWAMDNAAEWLAKYFGKKAPEVAPALKEAITSGYPAPGMTKEQVALVAGWPSQVGVGRPAHNMGRSVILAEDVWRYRTRYKSTATDPFTFKDGRLQAAR